MQVIYDGDGVAHVKLHETLYSPQALAAMASRVVELEALVTNLRDTLSTVADCGGNCADCRELAQLALDGRFGDDA